MSMAGERGILFNIQKYSLHDGPGIRTIVFLKGCPLRCPWCSNPESQYGGIQVVFKPEGCMGCGKCVQACPNGVRGKDGFSICDTACGACAFVCPVNAMEQVGKTVTVREVLDEVEKDRPFYRKSGGGMTLSGGEPLVQHAFAAALLKEAAARHIGTAIETTGYATREIADKVLPLADHILYDIKVVDEAKHHELTGVSNKLILENFAAAARANPDAITIRVPLIGGVNDDEQNLRKTAELAQANGIKELHLLPYHRYGEGKYQKLYQPYAFSAYTPDDGQIEKIIEMMKEYGVRAKKSG